MRDHGELPGALIKSNKKKLVRSEKQNFIKWDVFDVTYADTLEYSLRAKREHLVF